MLCVICNINPQKYKNCCVNCGDKINRHKRQDLKPKKECECGCGELIPITTSKGKPQKFKYGHMNKGELNHFWKGGIQIIKNYIKIWSPNHPQRDCKNYVFQHRLIYEQHYNCCLLPYTEIDHINENVTDNRIENLRPFYKGQHTTRHHEDRRNRISVAN